MATQQQLEADLTRFRVRLALLALVMLLAFVLVGWRLYVLQVLRHDELARRADTNRTAVVPIVPNRGEVFDRNGLVLASNFSTHTLEITPSRLPGPLEDTLDALAQEFDITPRDRRRFARLRADSRRFESLPLLLRMNEQDVARFVGQAWRFPGVDIRARLFRTYPLGPTGAHVIGYIGRINQKDKEQLEETGQEANYRGTDTIGKLGIEAEYESLLHGTTGVERMETSAIGLAVRHLASQPAEPGQALQLSLDIRLQKLVEDMYGPRRGALVAIDPQTGQVLALVSKPSFDPNLFVEGFDQDTWDTLNDPIERPLFNRALRGTYPPGSTSKPFMALAALESGLRKPEDITMDGGSWTLAGHTFRSGHALGPVNLHRSIVKSSNVYYYQLAHDMGVNAIHDFMAPLGFGQLTGIDLPGESRGILPNTEWKRRQFSKPEQQRWYSGETVSLGIGQGYNSFTMLQLASATATLASGGVQRPPHLLMARQDAATRQWQTVPPPPAQALGYKPAHVQAVLNAMVDVTRDGTSRAVFAGAPYTSGGKTGTAQAITIGQSARYDAKKLAEHRRDHSLYIGFAPAEQPRIAVAAIVENAGFGAAHAAPLVRRVMDYWLTGLVPSEEDLQALQRGRASAPLGTPRPIEALDALLLQTEESTEPESAN